MSNSATKGVTSIVAIWSGSVAELQERDEQMHAASAAAPARFTESAACARPRTSPVTIHEPVEGEFPWAELLIRQVHQRTLHRAHAIVHVRARLAHEEEAGRDLPTLLAGAHVGVRRLAVGRVVVGRGRAESHPPAIVQVDDLELLAGVGYGDLTLQRD